MRRSSISLLLASLLTAVAGASSTAQAHDLAEHGDEGAGRADRFEAELEPVNTDGDGSVKLRQRDGKLVVKLRAEGLDDGIHVAHIHGIPQAQSECPGSSLDTDGNGFVDLIEGLPAYGPVQVTLSSGLSDTGTRLRYERSYTMRDNGNSLESLGDLSQYAIVVHGVDLNQDHMATNPDAGGDGQPNAADNEISMPALCGVIEVD